MVTSGESYLGLVHISPTIRSKHFLRASCRVGVRSKQLSFQIVALSFSFCVRCTAKHNDLDGESTLRTRQHSDAIVEELELGTLWYEYGLVGDIVVRISSSFLFPFRSANICPVDSSCWRVTPWRSKTNLTTHLCAQQVEARACSTGLHRLIVQFSPPPQLSSHRPLRRYTHHHASACHVAQIYAHGPSDSITPFAFLYYCLLFSESTDTNFIF